MSSHRMTSSSPDETVAAGRSLGRDLRRGDMVALTGSLGSGKTQFVKGIVSFFSPTICVTSPTFVLVHRYEGRHPDGGEILIHHADLYRIRGIEELSEIGLHELIGGDDILIVEWADRYAPALPSGRIDVHLEHGQHPQERYISIPVIDRQRR